MPIFGLKTVQCSVKRAELCRFIVLIFKMRHVIIDKTYLKPDFGRVLIAHSSVKLNEINTQ